MIEIAGMSDEVELAVHDQGDGLRHEEFDRIFQRFGRSRSAQAEGVEGQGLGLYLSRGIVEAHGGRIWADRCGPLPFHLTLGDH